MLEGILWVGGLCLSCAAGMGVGFGCRNIISHVKTHEWLDIMMWGFFILYFLISFGVLLMTFGMV